jgi:hypothetical protein
VANNTLRQAIRNWQQRSELTGIGLVESTLDAGQDRTGCLVDATMARLSRLTPGQFTIELAYPWGDGDGAGALLGFFPDSCLATSSAADRWPEANAA